MNWILDAAVVVIVLLAAFAGYRKGALATLISLCGSLAALVLAFLLANPVGTIISEKAIIPAMSAPVAQKITEVTGLNDGGEGSLAALLKNPPQGLEPILKAFSADTDELLSTAKDGVEPLARKLVTPVANMLSFAITFFIILLLGLILVRILIHFARRFNSIPILGPTNRFLGILVGACKGLVLAWAFCAVFALILPYLQSTGNAFLANVKLEETHLFRLLYNINPITLLTQNLFQTSK